MELRWSHNWGVLFMLFAGVNLAVTLYFRASVSDQRGAYATGVLMLICDACMGTFVDHWRQRQGRWFWRFPWGWGLILAVFVATTAAVIVTSPSGVLIAFCFIATILASSVISRALRVGELRTVGFQFKNEESKFLWDSLRLADFPVLVPHRPGRHER